MNDFDLALLGLGPIVALLAGTVLFWLASAPRPPADKFLVTANAVRLVAAVTILGGIVAAITITTAWAALVLVPIILLVLLVAVRRYYAAERQSLLSVLLSAAEHGIPLDSAARAFARERNDMLGNRATQLADYLEAGVPLGLALRRSGNHINSEVSLAADLGYQTGTLAAALRQVVDRAYVVEKSTVPVAWRIAYLGFVAALVLVVQTFLLLKIVPVMLHINRQFGGNVPMSTQQLADTGNVGTGEFYLFVAFISVGLLALAVGVVWLLGFPLRRLPLIRRLWWRVDCSWVMRWLAAGVRQDRPILETLRLLASYFPQPTIRRRLEKSAQRVEQGGHWCDGLLRSQLIRKKESAVFKAAEQVGNLSWALDEMADSATRRWTTQLQVWTNIVFPLLVILMGFAVLFVVLGAFTPLVSLIKAWR